MTLHRLGAGDGYRYLTDSVAAGDGGRRRGQDLGDYYATSGNPPGVWRGSGAEVLGVAGEVSTGQMHRLYGLGLHPETGAQLGRKFYLYATVAERVAARLGDLERAGREPTDEQRAFIEKEEIARGERQAVSGFDATFSPVKSVSVAWALAGPEVAAEIEAAHHAAVADVIDWWEADVAFARVGANGIGQVDVAGVTVACFDHRTSRAGDPDLHTHAVLSNKVLAQHPGGGTRWLSLDSKALFHAGVAASERYNRVLEDEIGRRLGWVFAPRDGQDPADPTAIRELEFMPVELVRGFSARRAQVEAGYAELVRGWQARWGYTPPRSVQYELAQQATLAGRPAQGEPETVGEERARWAAEAARLVDPVRLGRVRGALADRPLRALATMRQLDADTIAAYAADTLAQVTERRAVFTRRHLQAAAQRATRELTMATPAARDALVEAVVDACLDPNQPVSDAVRLDPDELVAAPPALCRAGGESMFARHAAARYTTGRQLAAEEALLRHAADRGAPAVDGAHVELVIGAAPRAGGPPLAADQAAAVRLLACSGRRVNLLIGPAGAGKTTTLRALVRAWSTAGAGNVHGLAPTAVAAQVLKESTGMAVAETVHYWETTGGELLNPGDLIVVDEAGMVDTRRLLSVVDAAAAAGAKVVLVGDHRQLSAIESGGALRLLAVDTPDAAAELTSIWRFADRRADGSLQVRDWEATASLGLRAGDPAALDAYLTHGRVSGGAAVVMAEEVYRRWRADRALDMNSIMVAAGTDTVAELCRRARADLVADGVVEAGGVALPDGNLAGVGDIVVTRRNRRMLKAGDQWVRNGDLWRVLTREADGALTVAHTAHGGRLRLPCEYVAESVESGYAMTVHRAQGVTVDSAHTLVDSSFSRELLYVAATRGREANTLAVACDHLLDPDLHRPAPPDQLARAVLTEVLRAEAGELSATETQRQAWAELDSLRTLLPRYRYAAELLDAGAADADLAAVAPPAEADRIRSSPAWPALATRMRILAGRGADPQRLLAATLNARGLDGADDPAAVLHARLSTALTGSRPVDGDWLPTPPEGGGQLGGYLRELAGHITDRVRGLGAVAAVEPQEWCAALGPVPAGDGPARAGWEARAGRVAAYREAFGVTGADPLGPVPAEPGQAEAHVVLTAMLDEQPHPSGRSAGELAQALAADRARLAVAGADYWRAADTADRAPDPAAALVELDRAAALVARLEEAERARTAWEQASANVAWFAGEVAAVAARAESAGWRDRRGLRADLEQLTADQAAWAEQLEEAQARLVAAERGLPAVDARPAAWAAAQAAVDRADELRAEAAARAAEDRRVAVERLADAGAAYAAARARLETTTAEARAAGVPVDAPPELVEPVWQPPEPDPDREVGAEIDV